MSDDAFILLRVVRHWLEGNGPYYNPELAPVQVVTSPLNLLLTALVAFLGRAFGIPNEDAPILSAQLWHIVWVSLLLLSIYLLVLGGRRSAGAVFGGAVAATIALFPAVYFTSGMETTMALALVCFCLVAFQARRWTLCSVLLGLAFLARHDALLLVVVLTLLYARQEQTEDLFSASVHFLTPFVLVVVPWLVASLILYQTATPDTLAAKMAQGGTPYWPEAYYTGFTIMKTWWLDAPFPLALFILSAIGLIVARATGSQWATGVGLLLLYQLLHLMVYSMLGIPRYHWYFVGYGVALAAGTGLVLSLVRLPRWSAVVAGAVPVAAACATWGRFVGPWSGDQRYIYYRKVGEYIEQYPPERSVGLMEIGIIGYYAPSATIFDFGGIATPEQRNRIVRGEATTWLDSKDAPDKVVIRGERHPLEPDSHPDFEKFYALEKTLAGGKAFKRGLQVWRRRNNGP